MNIFYVIFMIHLAGFLLQLAQAADAGRIRFLAHDGQADSFP